MINKTLTTPAIADFTSAQHDHGDADDGGKIPESSVTNLVSDLAALDTRLDTVEAKTIPHKQAAGAADVDLVSQAANTVAVVFPVGRFSVAPIVTVSPGDGSTVHFATVNNVTASGCEISIRHYEGSPTTATITVNWHAVQMSSGAAEG